MIFWFIFPLVLPFRIWLTFPGKIPNFTLFPSMFCLWIPMKFRWVPDFPRLFGCFHACFKVWSPRFSTDFSVVLGDFGQVNVGVAGVLVRPQPSTPGFASPPTAPSAAPRRSSRGASWRPVRRPAAAMAVLGDGLTGSLTWWPTQVGDWDGELWGSWDFFFLDLGWSIHAIYSDPLTLGRMGRVRLLMGFFIVDSGIDGTVHRIMIQTVVTKVSRQARLSCW